MRINFEIEDLSAFLAVMDIGTFHGAAERLNLSQPAVSRRIKKLEFALGSSLFERTTRSVTPTLAAKRLQARAEALIDDAADMTRALRDDSTLFKHQRQAIVTVASVPSVMSRIFPPALHHLARTTPLPRIRFLDRSANETAVAVSNGEADFGVCSLPLLEPNTKFHPLFEETIILALRDDHPLAAMAEIPLNRLAEERLILPTRGTGNRLLIDETLARVNNSLRWTFEVSRTATALDLVAGGVGLAFLPTSALEGAAARDVIWRPVSDMAITRPVGLLTRRGKVESHSAATLRQSILHVAGPAAG
ncbi:MAG: LysR family transcriptional regulator [Pseudomonadota bacterium]